MKNKVRTKSWGVFYNGDLYLTTKDEDEAIQTSTKCTGNGGKVWLLEIYDDNKEIVDNHLFTTGGQSLK